MVCKPKKEKPSRAYIKTLILTARRHFCTKTRDYSEHQSNVSIFLKIIILNGMECYVTIIFESKCLIKETRFFRNLFKTSWHVNSSCLQLQSMNASLDKLQ